ncbi:MAG: gamma-glutamylcyclotransferase [Alphaproteobacteria bacterium]|nr:gamma-glutamylcyclotransferase [Alphaproteobacteria bacterium]
MSGHTFFFYGSLMDLELLEAVIDRDAAHLAFTPGWLQGFVAETALGYTFPTLVESRHGRVDGLVTQGLTADDIARVAYFEDTEYQPVPIDVSTADSDVAAQVFMATTALKSTGEAWSFEHWRQHHKPLLVAVTRKVMRQHYGITPFEEIDAHWHRIKAELEAEMSAPVTLKRRTPAATPAPRRRAARAASPKPPLRQR